MRGLIAIFFLIALAGASTPNPLEIEESVDKFYTNLKLENYVLKKFDYFIHAHFATNDPNRTVYPVAASEITATSPSTFGRILIVDNKVTVGPDPNSTKIGQYQGMNAYSDFKEAAANMNMNMIFTDGEYDGSTLTILGRQPVNEPIRELSIIGGTGVFRLARGTVLASTYSLDPKTSIGIYEYKMYVVTPSTGKYMLPSLF